MPFLQLNGITIPTSIGGDVTRTLYGEYTAGYNGAAQIDVRSRKKKWSFKTKPIAPMRAQAIKGLVEGNGFYFPYDSDFYSTSGYGANAGVIATIMSDVAGDGKFVRDENGTPYSRVGAASMQVDAGTTNLLLASQAQASNTSTFSALFSATTPAVNTTDYWEGGSSIKTTISGSGGGISVACTTTLTSGTYYIFSVFVYVTASANINVAIFDNTHSA